jgi:hypothetical protein
VSISVFCIGLNVQNLKLSRGALANQVKAVFASLETLKVSKAAAVADADRWKSIVTLIQLMRPMKREYASNLVTLHNQHQSAQSTPLHTGGLTALPFSPPTSPLQGHYHHGGTGNFGRAVVGAAAGPSPVPASSGAIGLTFAPPTATTPHSGARTPNNHERELTSTPVNAQRSSRASAAHAFPPAPATTATTTTASMDDKSTYRAPPIRQPSATNGNISQINSSIHMTRTAASITGANLTTDSTNILSTTPNGLISPRSIMNSPTLTTSSRQHNDQQHQQQQPPLIGAVPGNDNVMMVPSSPPAPALRTFPSSNDTTMVPPPPLVTDNTVTAFDGPGTPNGSLPSPPPLGILSPAAGTASIGRGQTPLLPSFSPVAATMAKSIATPSLATGRSMSPNAVNGPVATGTIAAGIASTPHSQQPHQHGLGVRERERKDRVSGAAALPPPPAPTMLPSISSVTPGVPLSLDQLLAHPVTLELLKDRVFGQSSGELIMFWLDATSWRRLPRSDNSHNIHIAKMRSEIAASIVKLYISVGAQQQVNLSHTLRQRIESSLATSIMDPKSTLFDDAIKEVYALLLHNSLPSFMKTPAYDTAVEILSRFPLTPASIPTSSHYAINNNNNASHGAIMLPATPAVAYGVAAVPIAPTAAAATAGHVAGISHDGTHVYSAT